MEFKIVRQTRTQYANYWKWVISRVFFPPSILRVMTYMLNLYHHLMLEINAACIKWAFSRIDRRGLSWPEGRWKNNHITVPLNFNRRCPRTSSRCPQWLNRSSWTNTSLAVQQPSTGEPVAHSSSTSSPIHNRELSIISRNIGFQVWSFTPCKVPVG